MSAPPQSQSALTADDYLAWEATQPERHEFVDGETFAMARAEGRREAELARGIGGAGGNPAARSVKIRDFNFLDGAQIAGVARKNDNLGLLRKSLAGACYQGKSRGQYGNERFHNFGFLSLKIK